MRDVVTLRNLTRRPFTDRASHRGDPADALSTTEPALSGDSVEGFDCAGPAVKDDPASTLFFPISDAKRSKNDSRNAAAFIVAVRILSDGSTPTFSVFKCR